jgi:ribosomal protein L11 methylase PrmA
MEATQGRKTTDDCGKSRFPNPEGVRAEETAAPRHSRVRGVWNGRHVTTAMSLRLLERLTREWKNGWSLVDLGTGTGIFALAAKRFGAGRVVGIDVDPKAISVAKANARLSKIDNVDFKLGDLRKWKSWAGRNIVAANLYGELLIEILPKLKRSNWLILSGVLRMHESEFLRPLQRNHIEIVKVNRRGKWIAILARHRRRPACESEQAQVRGLRDFGFARANSDR